MKVEEGREILDDLGGVLVPNEASRYFLGILSRCSKDELPCYSDDTPDELRSRLDAAGFLTDVDFEDFCKDNEQALTMDGFDDAFVGSVVTEDGVTVACYDINKVFDINKEQGMTYDEAVEFFYFNQVGAWVGECTPVFLAQ